MRSFGQSRAFIRRANSQGLVVPQLRTHSRWRLPMRIEQPAYLKPVKVESFRRNTRCDRALIVLGVFSTASVLGILYLQASNGHHVAPSQWLGAVASGPFCIGVVKAALWFHLGGNRFAEFSGDHVRLGGPIGSTTFLASQLVSCRIEQDDHFPEVSHLTFFFHNARFRLSRPNWWSMLVDNTAEAEEFRRAVVGKALSDGARFLLSP